MLYKVAYTPSSWTEVAKNIYFYQTNVIQPIKQLNYFYYSTSFRLLLLKSGAAFDILEHLKTWNDMCQVFAETDENMLD